MMTDYKAGTREERLAFIHRNEIDKGGHFAAFEQPALFTQEPRDRFRGVRGLAEAAL
jgi:hypothetical protein